MGKETIKSRFFEDILANETKQMAVAILDTVGADLPAIKDPKTKSLTNFVLDILSQYVQYAGWGEWSEGVDEQTKAVIEYLPWAMLGRVVVGASENLNYGRLGSRSVLIYQELAQKLDLDNDPRKLSELVDEKTGIILDLIEGDSEVDMDEMLRQVRTLNEAVFPSGS